MEKEDGGEFMALRKLHWFSVPRNDFLVIGKVYGDRVQPCIAHPCVGVVSFFAESLGGEADEGPRARIGAFYE